MLQRHREEGYSREFGRSHGSLRICSNFCVFSSFITAKVIMSNTSAACCAICLEKLTQSTTASAGQQRSHCTLSTQELSFSILLCNAVDDKSVRLRVCHHRFHKGCIDAWMQRSPTCPCCRLELSPARGYMCKVATVDVRVRALPQRKHFWKAVRCFNKLDRADEL